jgi:hypothetical protein
MERMGVLCGSKLHDVAGSNPISVIVPCRQVISSDAWHKTSVALA